MMATLNDKTLHCLIKITYLEHTKCGKTVIKISNIRYLR